MRTPEQCRKAAQECVQLAALAKTARERSTLLNAAQSWLAAAEQAERIAVPPEVPSADESTDVAKPVKE